MQLTRCPVCHCRINLESLVQDDSGRDLLAMLGKLDKQTGSALIAYLGLFRPANRDLANNRALRLAQDVLALGSPTSVTYGMSLTLESMRAKQVAGQFKPLSNHNYLKRVLEDAPTENIEPLSVAPIDALSNPKNARRAITQSIMNINDTSW